MQSALGHWSSDAEISLILNVSNNKLDCVECGLMMLLLLILYSGSIVERNFGCTMMCGVLLFVDTCNCPETPVVDHKLLLESFSMC